MVNTSARRVRYLMVGSAYDGAMIGDAEDERRALVLASASPRRRALLEMIGVEVRVLPADIDETPRPGERAEVLVERLARAKVTAIIEREQLHPESVVVGADTEVALDGVSLGKPVDAAAASRMLESIQGRSHEVITGLAVAVDGRIESAIERTIVWLAPLDDAAIARYVATGEPMGKAGAYAIQGQASLFVERIEGSHDNVVGLPLHALSRLLLTAGGSLGDHQVLVPRAVMRPT